MLFYSMAKDPLTETGAVAGGPGGANASGDQPGDAARGEARDDATPLAAAVAYRLECEALDPLLQLLVADGYQPIGPVVQDGVIVYDQLQSAADLPRGISDEQGAGRYRLASPGHGAYFAHAVGPHSWKRFLFPARRRTWAAERVGDGVRFVRDGPDTTRRAFIGVRGCELAAIATQDRVFTGGAYTDADYAARRANVAIIAVDCTCPARTCFCASMGSGPQVRGAFDLALTEVERAGAEHYFVARVGSAYGARLIDRLPAREAYPDEVEAAAAGIAQAAQGMGRTLDTRELPALLARSFDAPQWQAIGDRCLACTNCTMACPTCFCSSVDDVPSLEGDRAERWRRWDSCFNADFSYIHGGAVRQSRHSRYRQWLTHKLGTWWDQFGTSGCVGCGRCITWCPVGIDLTEEVAALRAYDEDHGRRAGGEEGA
ncbi:MAG TPA: 4Fe-4S dicluster domain-containing protein [Gemmatimonadaceae bacterium]|nr:4Fe-4S dicluster domain-containing protein [Gemmatimonadaceae bacterium]